MAAALCRLSLLFIGSIDDPVVVVVVVVVVVTAAAATDFYNHSIFN